MNEPGPIFESTQACKYAFIKCDDVPELVENWDIEKRQAEFNWWSLAMSAESVGHASLDHRLRGRPDVEKVVLGLVDGVTNALKTSINTINDPQRGISDDDDPKRVTGRKAAINLLSSPESAWTWRYSKLRTLLLGKSSAESSLDERIQALRDIYKSRMATRLKSVPHDPTILEYLIPMQRLRAMEHELNVIEVSGIKHASNTKLAVRNIQVIFDYCITGHRTLPSYPKPPSDSDMEYTETALSDLDALYKFIPEHHEDLTLYSIRFVQADLIGCEALLFNTNTIDDVLRGFYRAEKIFNKARFLVPIFEPYDKQLEKARTMQRFNVRQLYESIIFWLGWAIISTTQPSKSDIKLAKYKLGGDSLEVTIGPAPTRVRVWHPYPFQPTEHEEIVQTIQSLIEYIQKLNMRTVLERVGKECLISATLLLLEPRFQGLRRELVEWVGPSRASREERIIKRFYMIAGSWEKAMESLERARFDCLPKDILKPTGWIRPNDLVNFSTISNLLSSLPTQTVLVDFIFIESGRALWSICYKIENGACRAGLRELRLEGSNPRDYRRHFADLKTGDFSVRQLAALEPLLKPLFQESTDDIDAGPRISPGDTVVVCPGPILECVPLHAVPINGVPIFEKYPVVYCQSWTNLRHYLDVTEDAKTLLSSKPLYAMATDGYYGTETKDRNRTRQPAGDLASVHKHVNKMWEVPHDVEAKEMMEVISDISIFHYRGPIVSGGKDQIDTSMVLGQDTKDRVSARSLMECGFEQPALATVITCENLRIGPEGLFNVDPLIIPTVLQYIGATATMSTLWPVSREDGRRWSAVFYRELLSQSQQLDNEKKEYDPFQRPSVRLGPKDSMLNVALAAQKATSTLRLDEEGNQRPPAAWAGFVAYGFWLFPDIFRHRNVTDKGGFHTKNKPGSSFYS